MAFLWYIIKPGPAILGGLRLLYVTSYNFTKHFYQSVQNAKRKEKVSEMQKQQEQGVCGTLADYKF